MEPFKNEVSQKMRNSCIIEDNFGAPTHTVDSATGGKDLCSRYTLATRLFH